MSPEPVTVPHCPRCASEKLRNTRPTKTGLYRICSGCDHMWHEPHVAAKPRRRTSERVSRKAVTTIAPA